MSTAEFQTSETLNDKSNYVDLPGSYHVFCSAAYKQAQKQDGTPMLDSSTGQPVNARQLRLMVLDGTEPSQKDKEFSPLFFTPNANDEKWKQDAYRQSITAILVAAGLMAPNELGKTINLDALWPQIESKNFIVTLEVSKNGRMRIEKAHIYHVDDPRAAAFPKFMELVNDATTIRRKPEDFAAIIASEKPAANRPAIKKPAANSAVVYHVPVDDDIPF